jgi:hypothetical protein
VTTTLGGNDLDRAGVSYKCTSKRGVDESPKVLRSKKIKYHESRDIEIYSYHQAYKVTSLEVATIILFGRGQQMVLIERVLLSF